MSLYSQKQRGAVSLFIVIFSTLLITIITVGFIRLMIQGQMQATANDLSQSALDSAQAGVEDAKRALVSYCNPSSVKQSECTKLTSGACDSIQQAGLVGNPGSEVLIKANNNNDDDQLKQAYTCVKIALNTADYVASLGQDESKLIELKGTDSFDRIEIRWHSNQDFETDKGTSNDTTIHLPDPLDGLKLPPLSGWDNLSPALVRLQLLQFNTDDGFSADDPSKPLFNSSIFFKPFGLTAFPSPLPSFGSDDGSIQPAYCYSNFPQSSFGGYACSMKVTLPGDKDKREAYLRVAAVYNQTTFQVCLNSCDSSGSPKFAGVQPEIDSTGRAGDYFRRVKSRVEFTNKTVPDINAAVDIGGSLCKTFEVGASPDDYSNLSDCKP